MLNRTLAMIAVLVALFGFALDATKAQSPMPELPLAPLSEVNLADFSPKDFAVTEWYMPYYLKHFSALANGVIAKGPHRGFIDLSVWRSQKNNAPFNARIMENIVSLAWFYTQPRIWNPYQGDQNLLRRLEAAIDYWTRMQGEDGRFAEYAYGKYTLAPTAFGTKFVGRGLHLLKDDRSIDPELYARALATWRKALLVSFQDEALWTHGLNYSNQYSNLWAGALMYLEIKDDPEIEQLLQQKLQESMTGFQSPAGFFYEAGGPDWGYNLSTHHSNLQMAWHFLRGSNSKALIDQKTAGWYDWFSYNAVLEPGTSQFFLNRGIETRTSLGFYTNSAIQDPSHQRWTPQAERVTTARAFEISQEELNRSTAKKHAEMAALYPRVKPLELGEFWSFSPYAFVHEGIAQWHPSQVQKDAAIAQLPYLAKTRFSHRRHDPRGNATYLYFRVPRYYAIFNSGTPVTAQQRFGLGLLWNPKMGTVLQSQSRSNVAAYGTKSAAHETVFEAMSVDAEYRVEDHMFNRVAEVGELNPGDLEVNYLLGAVGKKRIRFSDSHVEIGIECKGDFSETIPLLLGPDDLLTLGQNSATLKHGKGSFRIVFRGATAIAKTDVNTDLEGKRCVVVNASARDSLSYEMQFSE